MIGSNLIPYLSNQSTFDLKKTNIKMEEDGFQDFLSEEEEEEKALQEQEMLAIQRKMTNVS
jgi:hypothetical protein